MNITSGCHPAAPPRGTREGISVLAEDVVRRFGDRIVLDHLRLEITASEFVVLLGPSGCGKTTLLRLLGGLDQPDAGTVSVPRARAIVFQGARLIPWQRVWQNVTIGLYGRDARMCDLVRALRHRHNATMLLVTHDVDEAIALADRILIMRDGRIGSEHRVELSSQDRSRGLAREELRVDLLVEIGVYSGG